MTKQPEALRLADALNRGEWLVYQDVYLDSAAELRRLHEEVKCEERRFNDLWDQFAALDKVNQELLEALKGMMDWELRNIVFHSNPAHKRAEAAIAKATGEQA